MKRVFIILLLIVILAGAAYFIFLNKGKLGFINNKSTDTDNSTTADQNRKQNIPAGWLEFSKKELPYTFSYPKEVSLLKEDQYRLFLQGPTQKEGTEFFDGLVLGFSSPISLEGKTLSEHVAQKIEANKEWESVTKPQKSITINGLIGLTYTASGLGTTQYIFLKVPGQDSVIEIANGTKDPSDQGYEDMVEKILATFSFL